MTNSTQHSQKAVMGPTLKLIFCLLFLGSCAIIRATSTDDLLAPPIPRNAGKDKFNMFMNNTSVLETEKHVQEFLDYSCEIMVVITNEGKSPARLRCASKTSTAAEARVRVGNSLVFTIKPHIDGSSDFWCNLGYVHVWTRFDAYTEDQPYICPGKKKIYRYSVRHDGLYADPDINGGNKIRALLKGHNQYTLWESFDNVTNQANDQLVKGFIDGGMCTELPDHLDNRAAVITVCNHQCLLAYDFQRCKGPYEKLQAGDGCQDFRMDATLRHKVSALKGC